MAEKDGQIDYGRILYSIPKCRFNNKLTSTFLIFPMSVFLIITGFIGIIDPIFLLFNRRGILTINFSYVLLFCSIAMFIMGAIFLLIVPIKYGFFHMPQHFKIYESGITTKVVHLTPFSKCDRLDYKNAQIISWDQILGFEIFKYEDRIVYLYIKDNKDKRGYKKVNYTFPPDFSKGIKTLKNYCLKNKVKQVETDCPKCGYANEFGSRLCKKCHQPRF